MAVDPDKCRRQLARTRRDSRRPSVLDLIELGLQWPTLSIQDRMGHIFQALRAAVGP